mmetsp:Transcript_6099/g.7495  ORF Transcript_6099/g.7495 Transcript_6099/m.7495 type:complete len:169 (-) Transcript_6099:254-760(-)
MPNEEGIPPGTYLQSCNGCGLAADVDGTRNMLQCSQCPKPCGAVVRSNIVHIDACEAFGNNAGKLVCDTPSNEEELPDGTYLGSCEGCRLTDGEGGNAVLSCSACKNTKGGTDESDFTILSEGGCKVIGNDDGRLVCEDKSEEDDEFEEDHATESSSTAPPDASGDEL